jgi:tripartite ATP-independent transporter DctM subunit
MAEISVGKLFMAAVFPGFVLSGLYCSYIAVRCLIEPDLAPAVPPQDRAVPFGKKITMLLTSLVPPTVLVLAVLGSIFLGIAPPTEAAAVGASAAVILTIAYRKFSYRALRDAAWETLRTISMVIFIAVCAYMFTGIFLGLGGGNVVRDLILATPGGRWGSFATVMFMVFILGFILDWLGILFIIVPVISPLAPALGFDPIWFAMMVCVNLQTSFMTPPLAYAIFFLRGVAPPELGITTAHIIRGVMPFVVLILVGLALCISFPEIILWLPGMMIK